MHLVQRWVFCCTKIGSRGYVLSSWRCNFPLLIELLPNASQTDLYWTQEDEIDVNLFWLSLDFQTSAFSKMSARFFCEVAYIFLHDRKYVDVWYVLTTPSHPGFIFSFEENVVKISELFSTRLYFSILCASFLRTNNIVELDL